MDAAALLRECRALRRRVDDLGDQVDALKDRIDQEVSRGSDKPKPARKKNDADPFDRGEGDDGDADPDGK